jgi:hypothetical protein
VIRRCGHLVNIEEPSIFNPLVERFVADCECKNPSP